MRHKVLTTTIVLSLLAFMTAVAVKGGSQETSTSESPQVSNAQTEQLDQLQKMERQLEQDRAAVHSALVEHGFDSAEFQAARGKLMQDREAYRSLRRSAAPGGARGMYGKGRGMGWMGRGGKRAGYGRGMRQCPYAPR